MREVTLERNTNETQIELTLNLDGAGRYEALPIPFFPNVLPKPPCFFQNVSMYRLERGHKVFMMTEFLHGLYDRGQGAGFELVGHLFDAVHQRLHFFAARHLLVVAQGGRV